MTVKELKDILGPLPDDMEVRVYATYDGGWTAGGRVTTVDTEDTFKANTIELWNDEG